VCFPHSSFPKLTGEPTFEDLKIIWHLLNMNDMSLSSYKGGGLYGHLGIIMADIEYMLSCLLTCDRPIPGVQASWLGEQPCELRRDAYAFVMYACQCRCHAAVKDRNGSDSPLYFSLARLYRITSSTLSFTTTGYEPKHSSK
jgi:hypothetical protein